ncbi:MAG: T9SS C-terminal target domain-containing protein [Saprospirales bacterium]|nr:MAG: T9SS C-terminal target domain-containing protein [Saprospirales bacterium]
MQLIYLCHIIENDSAKIVWVDAMNGEILEKMYGIIGINADTYTYGTQNLNDFTESGVTFMHWPHNSSTTSLTIYEEGIIPTTSNQEWGNDATEAAKQTFYTANLILPAFENIGVEFGHVTIHASEYISGAYVWPGSDLENCTWGSGMINEIPVGFFDVTAHELGHCFIFEFLDYNTIRNQTLHEGIADIIGAYLESFMPPNFETDWILLGDEPALQAYSRDHSVQVCATSMGTTDGPHQRGRTISHWFYAISEGIPEDNIPALGMHTAMDILLESLNNLNDRNAYFWQLREQTLIVVETNFGVCSPHYAAAVNAWDRVCVSGQAEECLCENLDAPIVDQNLIENNCPEKFVSLQDYYSGTPPQGSSVVFSDLFPWNSNFATIDPIITENGVYFAYYYDESNDCYSFPSEPIQIFIENCCEVTSDVYITENTTFSQPKSFGGNIFVKNGAILNIQTEIEMAEGKGIHVGERSKLALNHLAEIDKCPLALSWEGIYIEDEGSFDANGGVLRNVENGISVLNGDEIGISGMEIYGIGTGVGVNLYNPWHSFIILSKIDNFDFGIKSERGPLSIMELNEITNVRIGAHFRLFPVIFYNSKISSESTGIVLNASHGSIIYDNIIEDYSASGVVSFSSNSIKVQRNQLISDPSIHGIFHLLSRGSIISENNIRGSIGMRLFSSGWQIYDNIINNQGLNPNGGGIIVSNASPHLLIRDNFIKSSFKTNGIESTYSRDVRIENNYIEFLPDELIGSGIRLNGSTSNFIRNNEIRRLASGGHGIMVANTSFNEIDCNDIYHDGNLPPSTALNRWGLKISHNSPIHSIKGNSLLGTPDLSITSVIGSQNYHANLFIGGTAEAVGLSQLEIDRSQFIVNPMFSNHAPTTVIGGYGQWFIDDLSPNHYVCTGATGPSWEPFDNDPNEICYFYQYLKSPDSLKPSKYFLGLFDLVLLSKTSQDFTLPNCMLLDQDFQNLGGLGTLVDVTLSLDTLSMLFGATDSLVSYQKQWTEATDTATKAQLSTLIGIELESLYPDFSLIPKQDSIQLTNIITQLNSISSSSVLVGIWRDILIEYSKFLMNQGTVDSSDHNTLKQFSSLCSDIYGKPIHLARAMTATFDTTFYDQYDDCLNGLEQRIVRPFSENEVQIEVYPNPTKGLINISLPENYSGILKIMDLSGKVILTHSIQEREIDALQVPDKSGIYLLRFESSQGEIENHKIIVLK